MIDCGSVNLCLFDQFIDADAIITQTGKVDFGFGCGEADFLEKCLDVCHMLWFDYSG